ncbi:hypothetical protein HK100_003757 [Physocladia obscura]|uniref:CN hydrolase domain-containing protein n=1 Tax=Physocladia obscura TaxID=109957 RepID=A0AAD5SWK6_9FUNG|nr:hypothetical protein HK100_003757 [Physocladia obscura]
MHDAKPDKPAVPAHRSKNVLDLDPAPIFLPKEIPASTQLWMFELEPTRDNKGSILYLTYRGTIKSRIWRFLCSLVGLDATVECFLSDLASFLGEHNSAAVKPIMGSLPDLHAIPQPSEIAALQMVTSPTGLQKNFDAAWRLTEQAVRTRAAQVVVLPEYWATLGMKNVLDHAATEAQIAELSSSSSPSSSVSDNPICAFVSRLAVHFGITVIAGTIPTIPSSLRSPSTITNPTTNPSNPAVNPSNPTTLFQNTLLVFNQRGRISARYSKIHLFKFDGPPAFDEAQTVLAGDPSRAVTATIIDNNNDAWNVRLSVCYDLRFPELYRWTDSTANTSDASAGAGGYNVIVVPSAFTVETGVAHWETLLRARAIENQAYVIASAQGGVHEVTGRVTYGHSMIIDPWGRVVDQVAATEGEGFAIWELDSTVVEQVRGRIPALAHRRIY